jgi:hypothetical protein
MSVPLMYRVTAISRADAAPEVPSLAAALQLTTDLLEVLEEVDADTRLQVYEPVVLQLSSNCAAIRSQVATPLPLEPCACCTSCEPIVCPTCSTRPADHEPHCDAPAFIRPPGV